MNTFTQMLEKADKQGFKLSVKGWADLMGSKEDSKLNMSQDDFQYYVDRAVDEICWLQHEAEMEFAF